MKRFDLATAIAEFNGALAAYVASETIEYIGGILGVIGGGTVVALDAGDNAERWNQYQRAAAIVAWESGRAAAQRAFPGPVYDDDTMHALLAGACG